MERFFDFLNKTAAAFFGYLEIKRIVATKRSSHNALNFFDIF